MGLYQKRSTGAGGEALILPTIPGELIFASDCSTDGQFLLYETRSRTTKADLWAVPLSGERKPLPVVEGTTDDRDGQFSPDGKWVAYTSIAPAVSRCPFSRFLVLEPRTKCPPAVVLRCAGRLMAASCFSLRWTGD